MVELVLRLCKLSNSPLDDLSEEHLFLLSFLLFRG